MDLTASIRLKIDRLRQAKKARYTALSTAIEREVAMLTQRSADLFNQLEDAIEVDVLGKEVDNVEKEKEGEEHEEEDRTDHHDEPEQVKQNDYNPDKDFGDTIHEEEEVEYTTIPEIRRPSYTPSIHTKKDEITESNDSTSPENRVSQLRTQAQQTQSLLAEKHISLSTLRQKHVSAMKRLDKLQTDLEKVSQKWEEEERTRLQSESTSALGKRKREEDHEESRKWRIWGMKGVEWGVFIGIGIAGALGVNKLQSV